MHPILIEFGFLNLQIFTYGLLVATGFFSGILLAAHLGKQEGLDQKKILDLCFYIVIAALVGSRILYLIVEYRYFVANPMEVLKFWKGGLVFYGGVIGAGLTVWYYLSKHKLPLWQVADILAPSLTIGHAVGRWGCFFAGCCYGKPTDSAWGVIFTDPKSLAPLNVPLHPTQIYLSVNLLIIFGILMWLRKRKTFDGQVFWVYGILYSIGRFIIEFFRGDDRGYAIDEVLSTSQFIGIFTLIFSIYMLVRLSKNKPA